MQYEQLLTSLQVLGKDPARLIFEDELTSLYNRRFLLHYLEHNVRWDTELDCHLSLLMMDLDHFKQINDVHGHLSGDQALIHFAQLIKVAAGGTGLAIRYAGDEFMVLLPETGKDAALQVGERVLQGCHEAPLCLEEGPTVVPLTPSIGVASAPEDAQTARSLIQKADAALYHAKQAGRNRLANAGDVGLHEVPQKVALQNLRAGHRVGNEAQVAQIAELSEQFSRGRSQFLIMEGAEGMGKTTFLAALGEELRKIPSRCVKANTSRQEEFRPYYLATNILLELLNQQPDRGGGIFEGLSSQEFAYLAKVLPHLQTSPDTQVEEDSATLQAGIFSTLITLIPQLVAFEPLVILIDDLQFADAATLFLLRRLILRQDIPLFVCGTFLGALGSTDGDQLTPLERLYLVYQTELGMRKVTLTPLTVDDIRTHLLRLFPNITLPQDFAANLLGVSQGSPLMLGEVLRKLVVDQKITLVGQQWVVQPLEEGYLPESLEEIVHQKISALDEEGRQLLAQASTFGGDVSLSALTGSSEHMEAKVEEFLEQAVELGLISSEFRGNDEMIRFLGKRILDITYGSMGQDQKQELHERVGNYQETLYRKGLWPSVSYLAYHFKRSANQEKARTYEQLQHAYSISVFNADEAASYSGDPLGEEVPDIPLDPVALPYLPALLRGLVTAVRSYKLYPPESQAVANVVSQVMEAINQVLASNERLKFAQEEHALFVNGQELDVGEGKATAEKFQELLRSVELRTITFQRGLTDRELKVFLLAFGQVKPSDTLDQRFWQRFSGKQRLRAIHVGQVQYTERGVESEERSPAVLGGRKLDQETLGEVQVIIRCLLSTTKNIKLYPLNSKTITGSLADLIAALHGFLGKQPSLTLARAGNSLLVNGEKVDTSQFKPVADGFLEFLTSINLESLTVLEHVSLQDVEALVVTIRDLPKTAIDSGFWKDLSASRKISRILFDEHLYGIWLESASGGPPDGSDETALEPTAVDAAEELPQEETAEQQERQDNEEEEPFEVFLSALPDRVNDHLLKGETEQVRGMIARLFRDLRHREPAYKERVADACRLTCDTLSTGFQQEWNKLVAEPLLELLTEERTPKLVEMVAGLLQGMAEHLIAFAQYLPATEIFSRLYAHHRHLEKLKDPSAQSLAKILEKRLEPTTQDLVVSDLRSGDPARQQAAAQLLGSLGPAVTPLLIEIIKKEEELRVRKIAALLLAELGAQAGNALKQELVLEVTAQGRQRILEVIDVVTRSLDAELSFALGDENRRVRKAAFQLAERLDREEVGPLLMIYASSPEAGVATGAIKCLGKLKPAGATERLVSLLHSTKDTERAVTCCQALGQIADPHSVQAIARIVAQKRVWFIGRRWNAQVRAAATFALRNIQPATAAQALKPLVNDPDPRVREIARSLRRGSTKPGRSMKHTPSALEK